MGVESQTEEVRFLILHGFQNERPVGHWEWWLNRQLTERGCHVSYPQLPEPHRPALKDWLVRIDSELANRPQDTVVIAHSLACAAWIHLSDQGSVHFPVRRVLLVAPPSSKYLAESDDLREFQFAESAPQAVVASSMLPPRLAYSENDPHCSPPADAMFDKGVELDYIPGMGHLDMVAGYGRWLSVLRWCEDPDDRITAE
jgi:predicted alpha/beta hydrolase family esterase